MAYNRSSSLARYIGLVALMSGICLPTAYAEPEPQAAKEASESRSVSEPLTDFEKMELHYRRYSTAANNMAELVKQLNQKIQDVSLAAKTVEAKNNSHNRRLLEEKLRQLENTRTSVSHQYAQLHSQMQNEYRSYTALSSDLKAQYNPGSDSKTPTETATDIKTKPVKKDSTAKDAKAKNAKAKDLSSEQKIKEPQAANLPANDPQILDLDTAELRARRDGRKN
ncbi:hypothetical protein [Nitrosospira sp. NpAV]|uniref:hypothetical protein n=1 Tax=Nitrosospira sp. NpAV TaxID=58133 RepID=UPI00059F07D2|nr:hypothetical protein [Nitrosospira sp. NpAV]KIO48104.1 hypothetical protein SQ11_12975 [Nitrosospira sp. NpAV]